MRSRKAKKPAKNAFEFLKAKQLQVMKMYRRTLETAKASGLLDPPHPSFEKMLARTAARKFRSYAEEAKKYWGTYEIQDALGAMHVDLQVAPWNGIEYDAFCKNEPLPTFAKN